MDISKLARMSEFSLELDSLGGVDCLSLTTGHLSQANKKLESPSIQSHDLVRWLLGEIARHADESRANDDAPITGASLSPEVLSSVTDAKLEEFADRLIQKNRYLLNTHKGGDIERSPEESACDFLVRVFRHYAAEQKEQWERLTEPLSKSIFASATVEAMQRNLGLSSQFQDTIDKYARGYSGFEKILTEEREKCERMNKSLTQSLSASAAMDEIGKLTRNLSDIFPDEAESKLYAQPPRISEFHIPKNPIHDTNEMLESVVRQIEDLRPIAAQAAEIIRSMNDTALRMQTDYINNAKIAGRQTKFAIWIAAVGLVISSIFSCLTYVDAKDSSEKNDVQIKVFQSEIRDLVAAQREDRAAIVKAIIEPPSEINKISKPKVNSHPSSSMPH